MSSKQLILAIVILQAGFSIRAQSDQSLTLQLEPVVAVQMPDGKRSMAGLSEVQQRQNKPAILHTAFVAVVTTRWPEGLVPVFAIEREDGTFELRRTPAQGTESFTDPLFFALPREEDAEAAWIAGSWFCTATNRNGGIHTISWELAVDDGRIAGRFDPQTEYRVASISGGTFRSNRFELTVDYSNDRYVLLGTWHARRMHGNWTQHDGDEGGSWHATRPARQAGIPAPAHAEALYEWTRTGSKERRYLVAGEKAGDGWLRTEKPLCRVWKTSAHTSAAVSR